MNDNSRSLRRDGTSSPFAASNSPPRRSVEITDRFWSPRRDMIRTVALPAQWEHLEKHGCVDNFRIAAGEKVGAFKGWGFADSDLYKWIEAASVMIGIAPHNEELATKIDEAARLVAATQMDDGYINTYYQTYNSGKRLSNLLLKHELYCLGHMLEAACAHHEATGKDSLLSVAKRAADFVCETFGPGKNEGVPGHQEIELALVRLFRITGEERYLDAARFFIDRRGGPGVFERASRKALVDLAASSKLIGGNKASFKQEAPKAPKSSVGLSDMDIALFPRSLAMCFSSKYTQMHMPLRRQKVADGHSVRAMYFFTGAADLYLEDGDKKLLNVLARIWRNTQEKRTYVTGGMGSLPFYEGFGRDYELPNRSYTETCAAIASFMFSWRMLKATGDAKYADSMERTLYNAILSGISLDGKRYFYSNPLVSRGATERKEWYEVPCCPSNIARTIGSLEQYIYGDGPEGIWIHQYVGSRARFERTEGELSLRVESGLPFDGGVRIQIEPANPSGFTLNLRVPSWTSNADIKLNGNTLEQEPETGTYFRLTREWEAGDTIEFDLQMEPRFVRSPPQVRENRGRAAIMRGPLVYCLEDKDNKGLDVHKLKVDKKTGLAVENNQNLLGGIVTIKGRTAGGEQFTAIPYYAWANRGFSNMAVWLRVG
ncbi:MAG: beta-L-arabinofuranosidase domain-containing protein [bacterium]